MYSGTLFGCLLSKNADTLFHVKTQTPNLSSMICNLRNAISCTKRRSSKMGGGGNRAAWRIQIRSGPGGARGVFEFGLGSLSGINLILV